MGDAHLALHEITACRRDSGLPTIPVFGDVAKAFPRTWRADFINELHSAGARDGAMALIGDSLEYDIAVFALNGFSTLLKREGVPEGGVTGPTGFPTWFNSLAVTLRDLGHGIGIGCKIPVVWHSLKWRSDGSPCTDLTKRLCHNIVNGGALPAKEDVESCADLAASCLRALDQTASLRLALVLHADDPVLLSSSQGAAQQALECMAVWAYRHKVAFHVGACKTVAVVRAEDFQPVLSFPVMGGNAAQIVVVSSHKWLGLLWPADLNFSKHLLQMIAVADTLVASICGLISTGLPLAFALELFNSNVEGFLRFGRWLVALAPGAIEVYNEAFNKWACRLLGAPPWRSSAVASCELGWRLTGFRRAALDVAMKRARLWSLDAGDLYGAIFQEGHSSPKSWASLSKSCLDTWGVPDLPALGYPLLPVWQYKRHVASVLEGASLAEWSSSWAYHAVPAPYADLGGKPSDLPKALLGSNVPWDALQGHQSLCRLRAGLVDISHVNGNVSRASVRSCIFCGKKTYAPYVHVLGCCKASWSDALPKRWLELGAKDRMLAFLCCQPQEAHFHAVASLAKQIDRHATVFFLKTSKVLSRGVRCSSSMADTTAPRARHCGWTVAGPPLSSCSGSPGP